MAPVARPRPVSSRVAGLATRTARTAGVTGGRLAFSPRPEHAPRSAPRKARVTGRTTAFMLRLLGVAVGGGARRRARWPWPRGPGRDGCPGLRDRDPHPVQEPAVPGRR